MEMLIRKPYPIFCRKGLALAKLGGFVGEDY
jgi:hypothetical protein